MTYLTLFDVIGNQRYHAPLDTGFTGINEGVYPVFFSVNHNFTKVHVLCKQEHNVKSKLWTDQT
jgi:hypothetical protein